MLGIASGELQKRRREFQEEAGQAFDQMLGSDGQNGLESLIKQINHRVKGTEQFWNNGGLEAVLQVRAAYLSDDDRAESFHEHRPRGPAVGRNRATAFQTAK